MINKLAALTGTLKETFTEEELAAIYAHIQGMDGFRTRGAEQAAGNKMRTAILNAFDEDYTRLNEAMERAGV